MAPQTTQPLDWPLEYSDRLGVILCGVMGCTAQDRAILRIHDFVGRRHPFTAASLGDAVRTHVVRHHRLTARKV